VQVGTWNGTAYNRSGRIFVGRAAGLLTFFGAVGAAAQEVEHLDQFELLDLLDRGEALEAFETAFEHGDELFETVFSAADGVGANVGNGSLFTRVPRADLTGPGEWATHTPRRPTGPNADACNACHNKPADDGAGGIEANVVRDPHHTGDIASFIERNTPHLFGSGAIQRLAEEMTDELRAQRRRVQDAACESGQAQSGGLHAKRIDFGTIVAVPVRAVPCEVNFDTSKVEGVNADLVIRPFRWKGEDLTVRAFAREAANNELGLQAVELVGSGMDGDFDGVVDELTIGDITALEVYVSAQPRPVTKLELAELGLIDPLEEEETDAIARGEALFERIGCQKCHQPALTLDAPIFSAPSQSPGYRDEVLPSGSDPLGEGIDPAVAVTYDLSRDLPDNRILTENGREVQLGNFATDGAGRAVVPLYADLKRHDMGPELSDSIDETGTGASVWLTRPLWGVGSTAPYLHDGRATTLDGAIRAHGGEGEAARNAYAHLDEEKRAQIIAFLNSLMLFRALEDEEEEEQQEEELVSR
jgi:Di-haem oxidoreductase, putative peroxidase